MLASLKRTGLLGFAALLTLTALSYGIGHLVRITLFPETATMTKSQGEEHNLQICRDLQALGDEASRRVLPDCRKT